MDRKDSAQLALSMRAAASATAGAAAQQPVVAQSSPHSVMRTDNRGLLPAPTATFSILRTTYMDEGSSTWPKTTCLLSSQSHLLHVMKNWQPLELAPLLAMERRPGLSCFSTKFSSGNRSPKILREPVPSPLTKSPPWIMKSLMMRWKVQFL